MTLAVGYYRVSTEFQRETGYSLLAQRYLVRHYVENETMLLVSEFEEAESAYRSTNVNLDNRPALRAALDLCTREKATLVIAALDRLARNVLFVAKLLESKVPFVACDIPGATPFAIHIHAAMAEEESRAKGQLISAALALARSRGIPTSQSKKQDQACQNARALQPLFDDIRAAGIFGAVPTTRELERRGVRCPSGRPWKPQRVGRALRYLGYTECCRVKVYPTRIAKRDILARIVDDARRKRIKFPQIADLLNRQGHTTLRGLPWTAQRLWNYWVRLEENRRIQ